MISYDDNGIKCLTSCKDDGLLIPLEPICIGCGKKVCKGDSDCIRMFTWSETIRIINADIGNDEWLFNNLMSKLDTNKDIIYILIFIFKDIKVSKIEIFTYILELAEEMLNEGDYLEMADLLKMCSA